MGGKKYWLIRLFLCLFTMSVSVAVLPCGFINVHGLFGEVVTSTAMEDEEQEVIIAKSLNHEKIRISKSINIFNFCFELLTAVVCIIFYARLNKRSRDETIVTLKVRMDN